jgi:ankyrin repeat protein
MVHLMYFNDSNLTLKRLKKITDNYKNVNLIDYSGISLLHVASYNSQFKLIKKLLKHGANPNIQNDFGNTPIYYHCRGISNGSYLKNIKIIKLLLKNNIDITIYTKTIFMPLSYVLNNNDTIWLNLLIKYYFKTYDNSWKLSIKFHIKNIKIYRYCNNDLSISECENLIKFYDKKYKLYLINTNYLF